MNLAKPCLDVGLSTERWDEMREFYGGEVGLPFEEMLPLGAGARQYRFGLNGSVVKINHSLHPRSDEPTGYRSLVPARDGRAAPVEKTDPDGLAVRLVPAGADAVTGIEVVIAARSATATAAFYTDGFGAAVVDEGRYRIGTTL